MGAQVHAPISAVLQLRPNSSLVDVSAALSGWLHDTHGVGLESSEHAALVVEWQFSDDEEFACRLVISDSAEGARRSIIAFGDGAGVVAIIEESPITTIDSPHSVVDLSSDMQLLLRTLLPMTHEVAGFEPDGIVSLSASDPASFLTDLSQDLMPGMLIAVTEAEGAEPTSSQQALLRDLRGLTISAAAPAGARVFDEFRDPISPRPGSIVSVVRTSAGLDARVIAANSLRTKADSARRLMLRRQLSAPIPFDLERRRSAAMARLLTAGEEIDLPTALQLLDEESQRANDLGNRVKELETQVDRALEEQDAALSSLDDALSRIRYLERAFRDLGAVPTVEAEDDDDGWQPDTTTDALEAARELLRFLVISAQQDGCAELDLHQKRPVWAKKVWLSLRALNDYCRLKAEGRFSGDIAMYRMNAPSSTIPLLAEYAAFESESTSNLSHLKAVRTFSVPTTVHPSGKIYMEQHVKIDRGGQSAPRIHLYDDSGGSTQRIYIGYIGPHLPTSTSF